MVDSGNCGNARCSGFLIANNVVTTAGALNITVLQSGAFVGHSFQAYAIEGCTNGCFSDVSSKLVQAATVTHLSAADGTVIDTTTSAVVIVGCNSDGNNNFGAISGNGGYETLTDTQTNVFDMFEDDSATAFTDEQGAWTSAGNFASNCVIAAVRAGDVAGGGGGTGIGQSMMVGTGR